MALKIIVTTSNAYLHIIPVFTYLFNKYWGGPAEIVGYDKPSGLPPNFTFHSLGKQSPDPQNFTRDLIGYFAKQDEYFIWLMEDCFVKEVDKRKVSIIENYLKDNRVGRFNLTGECVKQDHHYFTHIVHAVYANTSTALYRLSTQPSIWNREFLLQYMQKDLSAWDFEKQETNDDYVVSGFGKENAPLRCNEGVRKHDLHNYNLAGFPQDDIDYINSLRCIEK